MNVGWALLAAVLGLAGGVLLGGAADVLPRFAAGRRPAPVRARWHSTALNALLRRREDAPWPRLRLLTELSCAAGAGVLGAVLGPSGAFWAALALALLFMLIAVIDVRYRLVLNVVVYPAIVVALLVQLVLLQTSAQAVLLGDLGWGDVKLAVLVGVACGFPGVMIALLVGAGAGGLVAAVRLARRRRSGAVGRVTMPYAPFLCLGAAAVLIVAPLLPAAR
jgi:prepilin signal peptidase PulO-like enzyme (type II secretory pathway)